MSKLADLITGEQVLSWVIIALLIIYFIYKEWPDFHRRIKGGVEKETKVDSFEQKLAVIDSRLDEIDRKLLNDYEKMAELYRQQESDQDMISTSLEERELIIRALLAIIDGVHQLGANGPTTEMREEITNYLTRTAHKGRDDLWKNQQ